ncbi:retrovirus-related pol polyprotein from transposon TNT 1-94 [Tanacetum coccineum]
MDVKTTFLNGHLKEEVYINNQIDLLTQHHPDQSLPSKKALSNSSKRQERGIQIHQSPRGIFINQAMYAQDDLIKHGMTSCDSIGTPMDTKHLDADLSGTLSSIPIPSTLMSDITSLKEQVEKGIVELFFIRTEYQLADLFTKASSEEMFKYLVR